MALARARLEIRNPAFTPRAMDARLRAFLQAEQAARVRAARVATAATRNDYRQLRPTAPPRPGRSSTGGQLRQHLKWEPDERGGVAFNLAHANRVAPHWIIQEIGTGERAVLREGGVTNPRGRPRSGASYVRSVRSQRGRRISSGLVFARGGKYVPPMAGQRNDQLFLRSKVTGVPVWDPSSGTLQAARIRISREIRGQHFVRDGGTKGFLQYRTSVLQVARQAFDKKGRL